MVKSMDDSEVLRCSETDLLMELPFAKSDIGDALSLVVNDFA
ncbi:MAG: hypothetical protein RIS80_999 [Actinomycetota bacterium]